MRSKKDLRPRSQPAPDRGSQSGSEPLSPPAATTTSPPAVHHAARRLAALITSVIDSESDPTTLGRWGQLATPSMSRGSVRGHCHAAGVRPKDALAFTRLLRALHLGSTAGWPLTEFIDAHDARTVRRLLARSGLARDVLLEEFLARAAARRERRDPARDQSRAG